MYPKDIIKINYYVATPNFLSLLIYKANRSIYYSKMTETIDKFNII